VEVLVLGLGYQSIRQAVEIDLIGRERPQAGMRSDGIVELQIATDQRLGLVDYFVGMKIDLLILDRFPHPLDEYIVALAPSAAAD
jgi:hypothetical protein